MGIFRLKIYARNDDNRIETLRRRGSRQSIAGIVTLEKAERIFQGGNRAMQRKEIIFFDELGFGWIVDKSVIQKLHNEKNNDDIIVEKTLADLLRCA